MKKCKSCGNPVGLLVEKAGWHNVCVKCFYKTHCKCCQKKVGKLDNYCKHCGNKLKG